MLRSTPGVALALALLLVACNGRGGERAGGPPVTTTPDGSGAAPPGAGSSGTNMSNVTIAATVTATQPGRPPLQRLTVDLAIDNHGNTARWIVIAKKIPPDEDTTGVGVDGVELRGKGPALLGTFLGNGGVHALRVAAHAKVIVTNLPVGWWRTNPTDKLPGLDITVADDLTIGGRPAKDWFGVEPLVASGDRLDGGGEQSGAHSNPGGEVAITLIGASSTTAGITLPHP